MCELITLKDWWHKNNIPGAFDQRKLQRWCRDGWLVPTPVKHGREYFVVPNAKLIKPQKQKYENRIIEEAKSKATQLMYLDNETVLLTLISDIF